MEEFYKLDNVIISEKQLNKICDSFFETVKNELPKEVHTIVTLEFLAEELKDRIRNLKVDL